MRILILALASTASALLLPAAAAACSCAVQGDPCAAITAADVVFVGRAVDVQPASTDRERSRPGTARFAVAEVLRGTLPDPVVLPNGNGGNCVAVFNTGRDYLVYAKYVGGRLEASLCSRTGELAGRKHEVDLLRERRRGTPAPRLAGRITEARQRHAGKYELEAVPLAGIAVTAQHGTNVRRTVTDADGGFVFLNVPPGDYRVSANLPAGYDRVSGQDAMVSVACYGEARIAVSRVPLHGTLVIADGRPETMGMAIHAFALDGTVRAPSPDRSTYTSLNHDGTWSFEGLPAGEYLVGVGVRFTGQWDPLRIPFWYPAAMRPEDAEIVRIGDSGAVRLALRHPVVPPRIQFSGVIVSADDRPVAGGVWLNDLDAGHAVANVPADALGRFQIRGWEGRRYTITAYACDRQVPVKSEAVPVDPASPESLRIVLTRPCGAPVP